MEEDAANYLKTILSHLSKSADTDLEMKQGTNYSWNYRYIIIIGLFIYIYIYGYIWADPFLHSKAIKSNTH